MTELVYLKNDEAVCSSLQVAEKFGKRHDRVLRAIDNLLETLPKNGEVSKMFILSKRKAADGQFHRMYFMNRDGFSLLVMGFTGKKALEWKLKYIKAFNQMEKFILERQTQAWIDSRKAGKLTRKAETDTIKKLVEYAQAQGSQHADKLYMTYSKLANKMAEMSIQAEDLSGYVPAFGWEMAPPSEGQKKTLEKLGILPDAIENAGKASKILDRLDKRRREGLTTPKQIRFLESRGFQHVGTWQFETAKNMIDRIAGNGWRVPSGIIPAEYRG